MKFAGGPAVLCALAAVVLALALQISSGMYDERALALATLAAALSVAAALWLRRGAPAETPLGAQAILGAGCAWGLACQFLGNPTFYADQRALQGGFRWLALTALLLLSAYLCVHLRASLIKARFLLLLACFAVMGIAIIRASPRPWVDVPHPPLAILTDAPGHLFFGDVRYSLLALMILGAWAIARVGQGASGELAALFVLYQPRTFFVLEFYKPFCNYYWLCVGLLCATVAVRSREAA